MSKEASQARRIDAYFDKLRQKEKKILEESERLAECYYDAWLDFEWSHVYRATSINDVLHYFWKDIHRFRMMLLSQAAKVDKKLLREVHDQNDDLWARVIDRRWKHSLEHTHTMIARIPETQFIWFFAVLFNKRIKWWVLTFYYNSKSRKSILQTIWTYMKGLTWLSDNYNHVHREYIHGDTDVRIWEREEDVFNYSKRLPYHNRQRLAAYLELRYYRRFPEQLQCNSSKEVLNELRRRANIHESYSKGLIVSKYKKEKWFNRRKLLYFGNYCGWKVKERVKNETTPFIHHKNMRKPKRNPRMKKKDLKYIKKVESKL